jgi:predicted transcriptional regulator
MAAVLEDPSVLDRSVESIMGPPLPVVDAAAAGEEVQRLLTRRTPAVLVRDADGFSIVTRFDVVRALTQSRA